MPVRIESFSDEQVRLLINLDQQYRAWIEAEQILHRLPYNLIRKVVKGRAYLYEQLDRQGNAKSLGPWSDEAQARLNAHREARDAAKARRDGARAQLDVTCRLYRALRLPMIESTAGAILREADRRRLLGGQLIVVGTNALPAYSIEANGFIRDVPDETLDFDLAWAGEDQPTTGQPVWELLKAVDPTFTVNTEREFQARNARAYEVEILAAPSRAKSMTRTDRPIAIPLPEQEWLLEGRPVDHVVVARDGQAARLVVPDPRWFALHKLWLADKPGRNPLKKPKDRTQGTALLDAVARTMPHYPLDETFRAALPAELKPVFEAWSASREKQG